MYMDRHKKYRAVNPYNGFKIKDKNSGWVRGMNIYIPKYDEGKYHNVLCNMRKSLNYIQDPENFKRKFKRHLENTGFDAVPVVCVREWQTDEKKRKKKFGDFEDAVIDYPDPRNPKQRLSNSVSYADMADLESRNKERFDEEGDPDWHYNEDEGKPWDLKGNNFYLRDKGRRERAHLWNGSYSCRFKKNRSTDFYLTKKDNSVMPAAGIWSNPKRTTGLYRQSNATKRREENERKIRESILKESADPQKFDQMRHSTSAALGRRKYREGDEPQEVINYRLSQKKLDKYAEKSFKRKRNMSNYMMRRPTTTKATRRGKYSSDVFKTIMKGPSKANIEKAIRMARNRSNLLSNP